MKENQIAVVVLAAGKGKRMLDPNKAKVMFPLSGKPLIEHVLTQAKNIKPEIIVVVVGYLGSTVIQFVKTLNINNIEFVEQKEQLGTGHAVEQAKTALMSFNGDVIVLAGDVPLLSSVTINKFIEEHRKQNAELSVLTAIAPNSFGYGRIIRDNNNNFIKITEEKDATDTEKNIKEINGGVFCVNCDLLFNLLKNIQNNNAQAEYYLTDIVEIAKNQNKNVFGFCIADFNELQGVNSVDDLTKAEYYYNNK